MERQEEDLLLPRDPLLPHTSLLQNAPLQEQLLSDGDLGAELSACVAGCLCEQATAQLLRASPLRIGEDLLAHGFVQADHIQIALLEQKKKDKDKTQRELLGQVLVRLGFLNESKLANFLSARTGLPQIDLASFDLTTRPSSPLLRRLFPESLARKCLAIPLRYEGGILDLAMADPYDVQSLDEIRRHFPTETTIQLFVASQADLRAHITNAYGAGPRIEDILDELDDTTTQNPASVAASEISATAQNGNYQNPNYQHPIVRLVDHLLIESVLAGASDIHFEPENNFVRVRRRVDGLLRQVLNLHASHWGALSHRLKIMSGMNIADTRSIQDGRFQFNANDTPIDCRVAIMPTSWGETIVVRLLDQKRALRSFEDLGFDSKTQDVLRAVLRKPQGVTIVTGPTGSGKTTSLYAFLRAINAPHLHVATLEDPVEYQMEMIRQTNVNPAQGIDFASGVRGILRMDPDVIFIGEIRDADTAQMAFRAAMTGHHVFTTLHCNDVTGAIPRLVDLGVHPRVIAGNVAGIVAQRLARCLCPFCKKPHQSNNEDLARLRFSLADNDKPQADKDKPETDNGKLQAENNKTQIFFEAEGCEACDFTGVSGRTVVAEVLDFTPEIDDLVAAESSRREIMESARRNGFKSMQENGMAKVLEGAISFAELARLLDLSRGF